MGTEMLSGLELREAVAVKVMGLEHVKGPVKAGENVGWFDGDKRVPPPPAYESDIGAAWLVVEKMQASGCGWIIKDTPYGSWLDKKGGHNGLGVEANIGGKVGLGYTAPEAICRAALAAQRSTQ